MFKEFFETTLSSMAVWLVASYGGVIVAMAADLASGLRKARLLGIPRNSRGYKRTCDKAVKYFLPMICLSCVDIIASAFAPFPCMTMVYGAYCIFCEIKSVMESTRDKKFINRGIDIALTAIGEASDIKSLVRGLICEILADMRKEEKQ